MNDRDARKRFEALWDLHYADLFSYALRRLGDEHGASDAAAETFLVAWRRFDAMPDDARPWLFGVARRVVANQRRGEQRREALLARVASDRQAPTGEAAGDRLADLVGAFNRLKASDREVLSLVVWEELKPREAARVLGIPAARFSVRLHRAKQRLRKEIERGGQEEVGGEETEPPVEVGAPPA
ncbi:MAG: RNA polymerase sigma factor, partial [Dehalococcoidia bacterium]